MIPTPMRKKPGVNRRTSPMVTNPTAGAWVAGQNRGHYSRHQSNDRDVEKVETAAPTQTVGASGTQRNPPITDAGQGECQEHRSNIGSERSIGS